MNLAFVGKDYWGRKVFKSDNGTYLKDVDGVIHDTHPNEFEGEPGFPVKPVDDSEFKFTYKEKPVG